MVGSEDAHAFLNLIASSDENARQEIARRLLREGRDDVIATLAATASSSEPLQLRARCLEVLALIARDADEETFRLVMDALRPSDRPRRRPHRFQTRDKD